MELLSKFENIKIENTNRVPAEDMQVIEKYAREFEEYRNRVLQYELMFKNKPLNPPLYDEDARYCHSKLQQKKFLEYFYKGFMEDCQTFINKIINYFKNKYQIELVNNFIEKGIEYNSMYRKVASEERLNFYKTFTYNDVLDTIFEQLGGFDFNSKAEQEIKNSMKKLCENYRNKEAIKLSKNKVILKDIYIVIYNSIFEKYEIGYSTESNLKTFVNAINYFEYGSTEVTELNKMFLNKYGGINRDIENNILFQKHELNFNKIKSFKFFKNGRIDIEFTNGQYALEFARDYCGYTK